MAQVIDVRTAGAPKRLNLYGLISSRDYACSYYRLEVPFRTAELLNEADWYIDASQGDTEEREYHLSRADVMVFWLMIGDGIVEKVREISSLKPSFDYSTQRWQFPASTVLDADDDVEYIDVFNPRYHAMGTIAADGETRLKPGEVVAWRFHDNTVADIWTDGETDSAGRHFDISENLRRIELLKSSARAAMGVTVSTPQLAEIYRVRYGASNIHVFPNSIIFDDYPNIRLSKSSRKIVKILWQGGHSHFRDLADHAHLMVQACERWPEIRFIIWGADFNFLLRQIPASRREYIKWVPYNAYKLRLATIDFDISFAPLSDRIFNHSKSAIKFYEPLALKKPIPTIASAVGPYMEILDGETGMLFSSDEEFFEKLGILIENTQERKRLAENGQQWLRENRDARVTVPPLIEWYRSLQAR